MTCARLTRLFVAVFCFFLRFGLDIFINLDKPIRVVVLLLFFSFFFANFVTSFFIAFVALGYHICVSWFCLFLSSPCLFCCFSFAFIYSNVERAPWFPIYSCPCSSLRAKAIFVNMLHFWGVSMHSKKCPAHPFLPIFALFLLLPVTIGPIAPIRTNMHPPAPIRATF